MTLMEALIIGGAVSFNILTIKYKFENKRYADAILDFIILVTLSMLFKGSLGGLQVATVASAIVSIYLWYNPPKLPFKSKSFKVKPEDKIKL